tara:strand:+ start:1141 stop:1392 length:252 start_codon:yes stop_codon:yes gene_type:complete
MTRRIFLFLNPLILSICIFTPVFIGGTSSFATQVNSDNNEDNALGIVIEQSNQTDKNPSTIPDLGDDQAFPFIPGFGKNSGKD